MNPFVPVLLFAVTLATGAGVCSAQVTYGEPTKDEIAHAYRSKTGEHAFVFGIRWETWAIRNIRGWSLKFKRVGESRGLAILTRRYRAIAKKNGICAEYQITDRFPYPPAHPPAPPQVKPSLTVEPGAVQPCR